VKTLDQLLLHIELAEAGCAVTFIQRTTKYQYEVVFDTDAATPEEARTHFLSTVAENQAADAALEQALSDATEARLAEGFRLKRMRRSF
jgi:hypothetical protein